VGYYFNKQQQQNIERGCLVGLFFDFTNVEIEDFAEAKALIQRFVEKSKIIKDAFYYPISLQECIQLLMLIANYPVSEGDEYEELMSEAHKAVYIFHTATNHAGE
jgi:hypothetical protein